MSDLKTLKDINLHIGCGLSEHRGANSLKEDIRQEAIKHIQHYQKYIDDLQGKFNEGTKLVNQLGLSHTINWIKNFFNITSEELK